MWAEPCVLPLRLALQCDTVKRLITKERTTRKVIFVFLWVAKKSWKGRLTEKHTWAAYGLKTTMLSRTKFFTASGRNHERLNILTPITFLMVRPSRWNLNLLRDQLFLRSLSVQSKLLDDDLPFSYIRIRQLDQPNVMEKGISFKLF